VPRDEFWDTPYLSDEDVTLISSGPEDEETQRVTFSVEPAGGNPQLLSLHRVPEHPAPPHEPSSMTPSPSL